MNLTTSHKKLYLLLIAVMLFSSVSGCAPAAPTQAPATALPEPTQTSNPTQAVVEEPTAAAAPTEEKPKQDAADTVLKNGIVYTMLKADDIVQAVAIKDGKIIYVGDDAGAEAYIQDGTQVIDLKGAMLSPGFMDGHMHAPGAWMDNLFNVSLADCETKEDYVAKVKEFVEKHPDAKIATGGNWSMNVFMNADGSNPGPAKEDLDAVAPDIPVILNSIDEHSVWVNSKAMEMAGITTDTKDPSAGIIARNTDGSPRGMLTDAAANLVDSVRALDVKTVDQYKQAYLSFQDEMHSYGITGITNLTDGDVIQAMSELEKEGKLSLRISQAVNVNPEDDVKEMIQKVEDLKKQYSSDFLHINTVKLFIDGVTEGGTAVFLEPYQATAGKGDKWYGEPIWKDEQLNQAVQAFDAAGIQVGFSLIAPYTLVVLISILMVQRQTRVKERLKLSETGVADILAIKE